MIESTPEIVIIAAMDEQTGIGKNGKIPWRIPEDTAHFKEETTGHPVVMGRVTWDSIPPKFRPLPERANIVVTRAEDFTAPGVEMAHSVEEAIEMASRIDPTEIYVMGGAQIYAQTLPLANRLDLTIVQGNFDCDAFFPGYSGFGKVIKAEPGESDWFTSEKGLSYRFVTIYKEKVLISR